jgi:hypothetical protein
MDPASIRTDEAHTKGDQTMEQKRSIMPLAIALVLAVGFSSLAMAANSSPAVLWGVDEDDHELFSIGDYTKLMGGGNPKIKIYAELMYLKDGVVTSLPLDPKTGGHIGSITLDPDGVAYMAMNFGLDLGAAGTLDAPVLLSFDTNNATTSGDNVVTVIGQIPIPGFDEPNNHDNISGLSVDPLTGELYALYRVSNTSALDHLLVVDPSDASLVADRGTMSGMGEDVQDAEDLEFDEFGNLYVSDDFDNHLYRVIPSTGVIDEVVDNDQSSNLGIGDPKIEGMAWDPNLEQMIGSEDLFELFYLQTLADGGNSSLGSVAGLTDVEAIDMIAPAIVQADGRLTGGGFQIEIEVPGVGEVRVSRGLTLHCDVTLSNNLQVNWPDNTWHITKEEIDMVCTDDPNIEPDPPPAPVDTFEGYALGSLNHEEGSILCFKFQDAGEPGEFDTTSIKILPPGAVNGNGNGQNPCDNDGAVLEFSLLPLSGGNLQAHFDQPHK